MYQLGGPHLELGGLGEACHNGMGRLGVKPLETWHAPHALRRTGAGRLAAHPQAGAERSAAPGSAARRPPLSANPILPIPRTCKMKPKSVKQKTITRQGNSVSAIFLEFFLFTWHAPQPNTPRPAAHPPTEPRPSGSAPPTPVPLVSLAVRTPSLSRGFPLCGAGLQTCHLFILWCRSPDLPPLHSVVQVSRPAASSFHRSPQEGDSTKSCSPTGDASGPSGLRNPREKAAFSTPARKNCHARVGCVTVYAEVPPQERR